MAKKAKKVAHTSKKVSDDQRAFMWLLAAKVCLKQAAKLLKEEQFKKSHALQLKILAGEARELNRKVNDTIDRLSKKRSPRKKRR